MHLTIRDLEQRSGLARRTIHYYARRGLLPAPDCLGRGASYSEEHLLRLRLIPALKAAGLRLEGVGCLLDAMPTNQMRQLCAACDEIQDLPGLLEWLVAQRLVTPSSDE